MEILLYYISRGEQITRKQRQEGGVNYFETRQMVDCDLSNYLCSKRHKIVAIQCLKIEVKKYTLEAAHVHKNMNSIL